MSGSETGLMASREFGGVSPVQNMMPFGVNIPAPSPHYQSSSAGPVTATATGDNVGPATGGPTGANVESESFKKKRGRPRKYGTGGTISLGLSPAPSQTSAGGGGFSSPPTTAVPPPQKESASSPKKARGRPPGSSSKKYQSEAMGSAGMGFTPHIITVRAGEDVSSTIMAFSQHGPRAVCILSAIGAISNVTLRQPATSGGSVTYEGRFEILSLSGSFLLTENGGQRSRTGGLSVSLSGPDGRVLGGGVAGILTAATPVQVVVASFIADGHARKESKSAQTEHHAAPPKIAGSGPSGASSPPSRGTLSESSGGPGSPVNQTNHNNNPQIMNMSWK
ncbi:hypothetical protein UlMin_033879 [Ulmus minor]